jgi:dephospho-CoA kinase
MTGEIHNQTSHRRWNGSQRRIGITGGIASGKSSVGKFLKETKGLPILDADVYAHEALAPGESSALAVLKRYGHAVTDQKNNQQPTVNRSALSKIIFNEPNERNWLEELIHPIVELRLYQELEENQDAPAVALIIPLLFEAGLSGLCSEIWVVKCTKQQQYKRLKKRDELTVFETLRRIQAQWPLEKKIRLADVVIDNSGAIQSSLKQVDKLISNNQP